MHLTKSPVFILRHTKQIDLFLHARSTLEPPAKTHKSTFPGKAQAPLQAHHSWVPLSYHYEIFQVSGVRRTQLGLQLSSRIYHPMWCQRASGPFVGYVAADGAGPLSVRGLETSRLEDGTVGLPDETVDVFFLARKVIKTI